MTQKELHLIDKSALVAEIKKRIKGLKDCYADTVAGYAGEISGLERLLSFIDTLETKEVDLNRESAWKPSDEQMKVLDEVLNFAANHESPYWNDYIFGTLNNLIRQLEKLKWE